MKTIDQDLQDKFHSIYEEGQKNPRVGFLRQYLNELPETKKQWTDEQLLEFIRIPFQNKDTIKQ